MNAGRTGLDCIRMLAPAIPIAGVIGLAEGNTGDVAGFYNGEDIYKTLGIAYVEVTDYGLRSQDDRARLLDLPIDILFVISWQRLIPQWLIEHCTHGAIGFHGSPWGIEGGRGRTPQNWALILGKSDFSLSMFAITPGVDSGNVLATREFAYTLFNDICSS
ncbi:MAG: hypothetical protein LUH04_19890 [Clostridium sp.]|nr:hypothetical protein [Clostridium sp.]